MLLKRVLIQNVRSFLEPQELRLDGPISIAIGPNGGGKTNLLDTTVILLRRHLLSSFYAVPTPTPEQPNRHEFRHNDVLNNMLLERHSGAGNVDQIVEGELEVTAGDLRNMLAMRQDAERLSSLSRSKYANTNLEIASAWDLNELHAGQRLVYRVVNGNLTHDGSRAALFYLEYLHKFEINSRLREEYELTPLSMPMLYFSVNRASGAFQSSVQLASYNDFEAKRQIDASYSRTAASIVSLAVGRLAQRYRVLLEKADGTIKSEFYGDKNLQDLTKALREIGYGWSLETVDPIKNHYDVRLTKQGVSFLVGGASSGERELLTYLFAIFALNVRDALIVVDEPELHLHPKWQRTLLDLFVVLSEQTGNQFLFATHSPTFVSPHSIQYVSRVFTEEQKSRVLRLDTAALPESRHLVSIVNSQNNERLFFADKVLLVEGLHDRIFFEALLNRFGRLSPEKRITEVISVGGKGLFPAYERLLRSCQIDYSLVADRDYLQQIGPPELRSLFKLAAPEIKSDVIDNPKSLDGAELVARIEGAMNTGDWGDARDVWEYIKARRTKLTDDLGDTEKQRLETFCDARAAEGIHVLRQGCLEDYLPVGFRSKDTDKLIRLTAQPQFFELLPREARPELVRIVEQVLGVALPAEVGPSQTAAPC